MRRIPRESTGRVIGLAVAFFGGLALLGCVDGVFERLSAETRLALLLFATGFAALTYALDAGVRAWLRALGARGAALRKAAAKSPAARRAAT